MGGYELKNTLTKETSVKRIKVLFIDDDESTCEYMFEVLKQECRQMDITVESDGDAARTLIMSGDFDIVISDLYLSPTVRGCDLLHLAKKGGSFTVVFSGYESPPCPSRDYSLNKPLDKERLKEMWELYEQA